MIGLQKMNAWAKPKGFDIALPWLHAYDHPSPPGPKAFTSFSKINCSSGVELVNEQGVATFSTFRPLRICHRPLRGTTPLEII
jgi:hypothetical protein